MSRPLRHECSGFGVLGGGAAHRDNQRAHAMLGHRLGGNQDHLRASSPPKIAPSLDHAGPGSHQDRRTVGPHQDSTARARADPGLAAALRPRSRLQQFTNSRARSSTQYYQDITDHNYSDAWDLGGSNVSGGAGYDAWVAGYSTTAVHHDVQQLGPGLR